MSFFLLAIFVLWCLGAGLLTWAICTIGGRADDEAEAALRERLYWYTAAERLSDRENALEVARAFRQDEARTSSLTQLRRGDV